MQEQVAPFQVPGRPGPAWPRGATREVTPLTDGTPVHAWHAGDRERPTVVLLHGIGAGGEVVVPTAAVLAGRYHVAVPDLPGSGSTPAGLHAARPDELADALAGWLERAGLAPATLVGVSAGCQVLLHLAVRHPEVVTGLVLQGPTVARGHRTAASQLLRLGIDAFLEHPTLLPVQLRGLTRLGPRRLVRMASALLDDRPEALLPLVRCPVLVVRGSLDPLVPHAWAAHVAGAVPAGRLVTVPRGPHALVYSRPWALAAAVLDLRP